MIISLSPSALSAIRVQAAANDQSAHYYVETILEKIYAENHCYFILHDTPSTDKVKAIETLIKIISSVPEFYGFKLLTEEEAEAAAIQHQAELEAKVVEASNNHADATPGMGDVEQTSNLLNFPEGSTIQ